MALIGIMAVISMISCSKNEGYGSEEAIERGDIVFQNRVVNMERFEEFLTNLSNKKEDVIRITAYTEEGDPIFQDLKFDSKDIQYTYDNSNDKFAGKKGIEKDVCKEIIEKENLPGEIDYFVNSCSKDPERFLIRVKKK